MAKQHKALINVAKINSFDAILAELSSLDELLPANGLGQFLVFNRAYHVVTNSIHQSAQRGYFNNPIFIEEFTVAFARYYFQAVNQASANSSKLPMAWRRMAEVRNGPAFVDLLMGANAHINHDLPLVLDKLSSRDRTGKLLTDVLRIDKLLMKSGIEILTLFEEDNRFLDFLKRHFRFLYYRPIMYMILGWRFGAWRSFRSIRSKGTVASHYCNKSIRIANRFKILAMLLSDRQAKIDITQFDYQAVASLDAKQWRAYYDGNRTSLRLFAQTFKLIKIQMKLSWWLIIRLGYQVLWAAIYYRLRPGHENYSKTKRHLTKLFQLVDEYSIQTFDYEAVATSELKWWDVQRYPEQHQESLELALNENMALLFGVKPDQIAGYGRNRTRAIELAASKQASLKHFEAAWRNLHNGVCPSLRR